MPEHADTPATWPLYPQVRVITPGHHEAVVSTATTEDAQILADMLRHAGCRATLVHDTPGTTRTGTAM